MSKKQEFKSISIKEEFAESIEAFIKQYPRFGYRSIAQFLEDSARRRMEELSAKIPLLPRFLKINSDENGVKIYDNNEPYNKEVDVHFKPTGIRCSKHGNTNDCEHVKFALSIPEVRAQLVRHIRENGWKIELPEE